MKRPPGPFWDPGALSVEKETSLPSGGDCAPSRARWPVQKSPHMAREPHQKSAGGGRSGRVGKTPQAHTGRKMSFSRRMSPEMTEFLFLPPSPHWIAFGNHLWIAAWGLRRTEFCETAFPGPFFFRDAGPGSAQQIVPHGKGRQIQPQAAARRRDNSCTSVCRYAGLRPAVRKRDGFRVPVRRYARLCAAVRRRAGTQPLLGTCRVFVPSPLSMPGFRPVISMPGFRPVILRRRSRRRIFFPFL